MRLRRPASAGLLALALAATAQPAGAVTVADYQKWRHATRTVRATPTGLVEVRLGGILSGLLLANRRLGRAGGPLLFCPPAGAPEGGMASGGVASGGMASGDLRKRVDAELKSPSRPGGEPWPADTGIGTVVLHILQRAWQCPAGRPTLR